MKDLITYFLALIILVVFSFTGKISLGLIASIGLLYVVYLFISVWKKEKFDDDEDEDLDYMKEQYPQVNVIIRDSEIYENENEEN